MLGGPGAAVAPTASQLAAIQHAPTGSGTALGSLGRHYTWRQAAAAVESGWIRRRTNPNDWLRCAREWGAALTLLYAIRRWATRRRGREANPSEKARCTWRRWAHTRSADAPTLGRSDADCRRRRRAGHARRRLDELRGTRHTFRWSWGLKARGTSRWPRDWRTCRWRSADVAG